MPNAPLPKRLLTFAVAAMILAACQTDGGPELGAADDGTSIAGLAENAEREGNHEIAAQRYLSRFENAGENPADLIAAARNLRYAGRASDGIRILTQYYDTLADSTDFRFELGKSRIAAGKSSSAIPDLLYVTEKAPDDWEGFSALGIAYDMTNDYETAHEAYRRAIDLSDHSPATLNNYALSLALSGDLDGAVEFLKGQPRAIRRSPHIRQNLAMFMAIQGDLDTAGELARMDLEEDQVMRNLQFYQDFTGQ